MRFAKLFDSPSSEINMRNAFKLCAVIAVVLSASVSLAAPPLFPYQGRLDKNGAPQNGNFDFRFSLFTAATGGAQLWSADFVAVPVVNGNFSVKLGSTTPIPDTLLAQSALFLAVQVKGAGDAAFRPLAGRQQWLHVPYAATSSGDFRVNGLLTVGMAPDGGAANAGISEQVVGTLRVTNTTGGRMDINSQTIDSNTTLTIQQNGSPAIVAGNLTVNGTFTAPNTWAKIYDGYVSLNASTPLTISGLDASRQRIYKIFYTGWIGTTADSRLLLRINGNATGYRSYIATDGDQAFSEWDTTGYHLGRSVNNRSCDVSGEVNLFASGSTNRLAIRGNGSIVDYDTNANYGTRIGGIYGTYTNTTSLVFTTTGSGGYNGRFVIYSQVP